MRKNPLIIPQKFNLSDALNISRVHKKSDKKSELALLASKVKEHQDEFPNFFDMIKKTSAQKLMLSFAVASEIQYLVIPGKRQSFEVGQILNVAKSKRGYRISIVFLPLRHFPIDKKAVERIYVNPKSVQPFNEFYDQNLPNNKSLVILRREVPRGAGRCCLSEVCNVRVIFHFNHNLKNPWNSQLSRNDKESLLLDFCSALHQAMLLIRLKIDPFTDKLPDTFITDLPKAALPIENAADSIDFDSADGSSSEISFPPSVATNKKKSLNGETERLVEMFESPDVLDLGRKILNDEFECERINSYKKKIKNGYFGFAIPREAVIFDDEQLDKVMEILRVIIDQSAQASNMPFVFEVLLPEFTSSLDELCQLLSAT
uniref:Uncharacterized protein n=1 Tax=Romanomermis culicivorax TaxID=13658 RepID=A0A915IC94_ROMCU